METGTVTVLSEPVKASSDQTPIEEIIKINKVEDKSSRKVRINCRTQSKCYRDNGKETSTAVRP